VIRSGLRVMIIDYVSVVEAAQVYLSGEPPWNHSGFGAERRVSEH
jgi:hypothetical protein